MLILSFCLTDLSEAVIPCDLHEEFRQRFDSLSSEETQATLENYARSVGEGSYEDLNSEQWRDLDARWDEYSLDGGESFVSNLDSVGDVVDDFVPETPTSPGTGASAADVIAVIGQENGLHSIEYLESVQIPVTTVDINNFVAGETTAGTAARGAWSGDVTAEHFSVTMRQRADNSNVFDISLWPTSASNEGSAPYLNRNGGHFQLAKIIHGGVPGEQWEGRWFGGGVVFDQNGKVVDISANSGIQGGHDNTNKTLEGDALRTFINIVHYAIGNLAPDSAYWTRNP